MLCLQIVLHSVGKRLVLRRVLPRCMLAKPSAEYPFLQTQILCLQIVLHSADNKTRLVSTESNTICRRQTHVVFAERGIL